MILLIIVGGWLLYKYVYTIKSSEQRTRASEERFRSLSEQSLVGIYLIRDSLYIYVNPKFAEIFGYSVDECLDNMNFSRLVHPEDIAMVSEQVRQRALRGSPILQYEFRGVRKDGQGRPCGGLRFILRSRGVPVVIGTMQDITDRKLAEKALRESEERNRQILRMATDGFCRTDISGRLIEVNQAYCQMSGYEEQELLAMNLIDLDGRRYAPRWWSTQMQKIVGKRIGSF